VLRGCSLSQLAFWTLAESQIVGCPACFHSELDPPLPPKALADGCRAYFLRQQRSETTRTNARHARRSFRKGVAFAVRLRRLHPATRWTRVLELGAGDGFFSRGFQFVFTEAEVTVVDVVPEVLRHLAAEHGFRPLQVPVEALAPHEHGTYDLIIARDVLEHISEVGTVLPRLAALLAAGGFFHFITPNGVEDAWPFRLRQLLTGERSLLLLNHVNYFDPVGLRDHLMGRLGLERVEHFLYNRKWFRRGRGWKRAPRLMASPASASPSVTEFLGAPAELATGQQARAEDVVGSSWLLRGPRFLAETYCALTERLGAKLPAEDRIGHEIFGLYRKP